MGGANLAKYLGTAAGEEIPICIFFGSICTFLSFAYTYLAALDCDLSVYIPMSESVQLVVTAFTGMIIWGDLQRIPCLLNYIMVYALIILGVYELSTHDLFGFTVLIKGNRLSKQAVISYAKLIGEVQSGTNMRDDISATHLLEALANLMRNSIDKGELTTKELTDMIKNYQRLRRVEDAAARFKKSGENLVRKESSARIVANKWLERSKTSHQALNEPLLDPISDHDLSS